MILNHEIEFHILTLVSMRRAGIKVEFELLHIRIANDWHFHFLQLSISNVILHYSPHNQTMAFELLFYLFRHTPG